MPEEEGPRVRVRAREEDYVDEGEIVTCSRKAARRAGALKDWMDDTSGDGAFPTIIPAADLRVILGLCEDGDGSQLATHSVEELVAVMDGANFLDAPCAFRAAARQLNTRFLAGKSVEELRTNLGAENDMSKAEQVAALAEPAYTPPPTQEQAEVPPRVQRGVSERSSSTSVEDVLETALGEADTTTLCRLKAVSAAWRTRARRKLWGRLWPRLWDRLGWRELWGPLCQLCHRDVEGQPKPTVIADITDLDVECLQEAGRLWGVVVAGRQHLLPKLARLHGYGFVVDVQRVRRAGLSQSRSGPLGGAALRRCIEGEGEPPPELLLAAVACAASGKVLGVPVQRLREDDAIGSLALRGIGVIAAGLLGLMLPAATSVHSLSLRGNRLCGGRGTYTTEGITKLCEGLRGSAVTSLDLAGNHLCGGLDFFGGLDILGGGSYTAEGITKLCEGLQGSAVTSLDLGGNQLCGLSGNVLCGLDYMGRGTHTTEGITQLCEGLRGSAITSLDLQNNYIGQDDDKVAIRQAFRGPPANLQL